jgi:hypothetical protein
MHILYETERQLLIDSQFITYERNFLGPSEGAMNKPDGHEQHDTGG